MQNITHYLPKINTNEVSDDSLLIKQFDNLTSIELLRLIEDCDVKVDLDYYPNNVFYFKNGKYMMSYDITSETIWLSNPHIWMVFEGEFSLSYFEISNLSKSVLNKLFNYNVDIVRAGYDGSVIELEKHFVNKN